MILPLPGPGTHPHDWHHDVPAPERDYSPASPRYVRVAVRRSPASAKTGDRHAWRRYRGVCGRGRWRGVDTVGVWMSPIRITP
jgi:hypothetical protein